MKNKSGKVIVASMIVAGILFAGSVTGLAMSTVKRSVESPTVTLQAKGSNGAEFSINREDTDLFDNFKGIVPGDRLEQGIVVRNNAKGISGGNDFNIYLYATNGDTYKSDGQGAVPEDIFTKTKITVYDGDKVLDLKLKDNDAKGTLLGKFSSGDSKKYIVKLEVPTELGNEYQNCVAEIKWHFYAEQVIDGGIETHVPVEDMPKTGVDSNTTVLAVIAVSCMAIMIALIILKEKTDK